jgi:hypothetical protein
MSISEEAVVKCDCKVDDGGSSADSRGIDVVMEHIMKEEGGDAVVRIFRRQFVSTVTCNYFYYLFYFILFYFILSVDVPLLFELIYRPT